MTATADGVAGGRFSGVDVIKAEWEMEERQGDDSLFDSRPERVNKFFITTSWQYNFVSKID